MTMTVNRTPTLTGNPASIAVREGSLATFAVAATGTALTYQWEQRANGGSAWSPVSGASAATYAVTATPGLSGYQYRCTVSGAATCASATSSAATLTVNLKSPLASQYTVVPRIPVKELSEVAYAAADSVREAVTYFDWMGRESQAIQINGFESKDLVGFTTYDPDGLQRKQQLPYARANNRGAYVVDPLAEQQNYYYGQHADSSAYSATELEQSPLARPLSVKGTGKGWKNHPTTYSYRTCGPSEVRKMVVSLSTGLVVSSGYYAAGEVSVTEVTDPDGRKVTSFVDGMGRSVLVDQDGYKTYTVYDELGRISLVLPPKAAELAAANSWNLSLSSATLLSQVYTYTYDDRSRLVEKRVPGKQPEEFVYDPLGRVVLYRNGNLKASSSWKAIKYDVLGRVAYWGIATGGARADLQAQADSQATLFETLNADGTYTSSTTPALATADRYAEYFYDKSYGTFSTHAGVGAAPSASLVFSNPKGLVTRLKVRNLSSAAWETRDYFYDKEGRLIQEQRANTEMSSYRKLVVNFAYAFDGLPTTCRYAYYTLGTETAPTFDILYAYTYNAQGKLGKVATSYTGNAAPATAAEYAYDAFGRTTAKYLGGDRSSKIQQVSYAFSIKGWLMSITTLTGSGLEGLFSETLHYQDGLASLNGSAQWGGKVSGMEWKINRSGDALKRGYGYQYDSHGRLTTAKYGEGATFNQAVGQLDEAYTYDANSNISTLVRKGLVTGSTYGTVDNLGYTYTGNQLQKVTKATGGATNAPAFPNLAEVETEYTYDANGNMTADKNRGITALAYNLLDLPASLSAGGSSYQFAYNALGEKLYAAVGTGNVTARREYAGPFTFENGALRSVAFPEGRLNGTSAANLKAEYFITDHLGSVRVAIEGSGGAATPTYAAHYYPSGLKIADRNVPGTQVNTFAFGGKEETDNTLAWLDFSARYYDPSVARWMCPDPLAEQFAGTSPYSYCMGDPVNMIDPNGLAPYSPGSGSYGGTAHRSTHTDGFGNVIAVYNDGDLGIYAHYGMNALQGYNKESNTSGGGLLIGVTSRWDYYLRNGSKDDHNGNRNNIIDKVNVYTYYHVDVPAPSGQGGITPSGDKFYSEEGNLLWNTNMKGEPNRVLVFKPKGNQNFNAIVQIYKDRNDPIGLLTRMRELSKSYNFFAPDTNSPNLQVYDPVSGSELFLMFLHFAGEGFAAGYNKGNVNFKKGGAGLGQHYDMMFGAREYWLERTGIKTFDPWWK